MTEILENRKKRLKRLRSYAIEANNISKKYQADRLIAEVSTKLHQLETFKL
jgi:hypothetical protein